MGTNELFQRYLDECAKWVLGEKKTDYMEYVEERAGINDPENFRMTILAKVGAHSLNRHYCSINDFPQLCKVFL